jgi:type VI secretion system Hcp family effector
MVSHSYIAITVKTQGLISAGCSSLESIGNKCQAGHTDERGVPALNHGMASVANIKRHQAGEHAGRRSDARYAQCGPAQ